ncbi:MAG TPA: amidohydrolase family protein [Burkholderiaceae bacterium]|nr:amidohydrolase family protein [Burkholderiaceae bacterium]
MIDCHTHVLDPDRFPFTADTYRPHAGECGNLEQFLATLDRHQVSHAVVVQPTSGYDRDHRCLLDALQRAGNRICGIARILPQDARDSIGLLDVRGMRGVRIDPVKDGAQVCRHPDFAWLRDALRERGAVLQLQCEGDQLAELLPLLGGDPPRIVIDHCGRPDPARGLSQPGFAATLELGRRGHFVKLSGPFRFSREPFPHADADPYVSALVDAFSAQRCVWASDWPFLRFADAIGYDDAIAFGRRWVGDPDRLDAAARTLFGFDDAPALSAAGRAGARAAR